MASVITNQDAVFMANLAGPSLDLVCEALH